MSAPWAGARAWRLRAARASGSARAVRGVAGLVADAALGERTGRKTATRVLGSDFSAADLLQWAARRHATRVFLEYGAERIGFSELNRRSNRLARHLARAGLRPGQGLALLLGNHPRFLEAFFAAHKLGSYCVALDAALAGERLARALNDSGADAVLLDHETAPRVSALREHLGRAELRFVSTLEAPADFVLPEGMRDCDELYHGTVGDGDDLERPRRGGLLPPLPAAGASPAAAHLRRLGLLANIDYERRDRLYLCLPLSRPQALLASLSALWIGLAVRLGRRFSAATFWQEVAASEATTCHVTKGMIASLLDAPASPHDRAHRLRRAFCKSCSSAVGERFAQRFGVEIREPVLEDWLSGSAAPATGFAAGR